jgi:hypothetical protein
MKMLKRRSAYLAPWLLAGLLLSAPSTTNAYLYDWPQALSPSSVQDLFGGFQQQFADKWKGPDTGLSSDGSPEGLTRLEDVMTPGLNFGSFDFTKNFAWWTLLYDIGAVPTPYGTTPPMSAVPIPGSVLLFGSGLLAMAGFFRQGLARRNREQGLSPPKRLRFRG